jgi:hypothetical protein
MPIRSPRGRMSAYRVLWQWPLRSPARLAVTVATVIALAVGASLAVGVLSGGSTGSAGLFATGRTGEPSAAGRAAGEATPTAPAPVPESTPTTLPLSQAPPAALDVAARWAAAWVSHPPGITSEQWVAGLRDLTTPEYLGVLAGVDPANIPASSVTGGPQPVRVEPRSVQVQVPTDTLTLLVLVVESENGWRVAGYDRV